MIDQLLKKLNAIRATKHKATFTIDLLKGEGVPIKSRPEGIAVAAVTFAVPIIIAIIMFGFYLSNSIAMSIQKQGIVNYDTKIDKLSDAVELQKSFKNERDNYTNCLSEVSTAIGGHTQWSPVLVTVVKNLPGSVVLTSLEVKQRSVRRKAPKNSRQKYITVPARTLEMTVCGSPQSNCDKAVRDFRDNLRFSTLLGAKLEDIKVSQEVSTLDGEDAVCYQIDCFFKPRILGE